jgi:hypothetical protein
MTYFLGIKMTHVPVLSIIIMILIVTMQLVNKFLFIDKEKHNILLTLIKQKRELALTMPFFQSGSIDMYKMKKYSPYKIVMMTMYYLSLLVGLMLTETVFGRYNMLLLLLIGVGINFVVPIFDELTCEKQYYKESIPVSMVSSGTPLCCGEPITWYYIGIIASILLNYHFLVNKKLTTLLFVFIYFIIGFLLTFGQFKFLENQNDKSLLGCTPFMTGLVPYLLGGAFTFGSLGLLFTKF